MMKSQPTRVFIGISIGILLLILFAWIGQQLHLRGLSHGTELRQQRSTESAIKLVQSDFELMQRKMLAMASEVATVVLKNPLAFEQVPSPALIQDLEEIEISEHQSLSVFDPHMQLVAWQGKSHSLNHPSDASNGHWEILRDDQWRVTLALWQNVIINEELVGTICITQNLFSKAPVLNSILNDYDIVDSWKRHTGLEIQVSYADTTGHPSLQSLDGQKLASYTIVAPTESTFIASTSAWYTNLMVLGLTFLILWIICYTWYWYRSEVNLSRLTVFVLALSVGRVVFLLFEIPSRYQTGKAPLSPLFDPVHLASTFGGGLMRSIGDLSLTALCIFLIGLAVLQYANVNARFRAYHVRRLLLWITIPLALIFASILMEVVHASVLDSTMSYTGRSILIPSTLELTVYASLVLMTLGILLTLSTMMYRGFRMKPDRVSLIALGVVTIILILVFHHLQWSLWIHSVGLIGACVYISSGAEKVGAYDWLAIRRLIPGALAVCLLLYPVYYQALEHRKQDRVEYAASTFGGTVGGSDVSVGVQEVIQEVLQSAQHLEMIQSIEELESEARNVLRGSLLGSLGAYDASISFLTSDGEEIHTTGQVSILSPDMKEQLLQDLSNQLEDQGRNHILIGSPIMGLHQNQYAGLAALGDRWILVQAQPHIIHEEANTPLLRVLLSSDDLDLYKDLSLASFRDRKLAHTFGRRFTKYRLEPDVAEHLTHHASFWTTESVGGGRDYRTYYLHRSEDIVAARVAVDGPFDHLYYLLRFAVGGLILGIPFYVVGCILRLRIGILPRQHFRYQDKVMNAFFLLAVIAVIPVGIAGYNVVTEENEKAVQSWLRQHLERVESSLIGDGRSGKNSVEVLERSNIDSLSARVGLDLNVYQETQLISSSRQQLVEDRIVDQRLPAQAYSAIYGNGEQFTFVNHTLGDFEYTAGYRAILDETGDPVYVLSVPDLPEADRIQEERARTLAYLFGAMLGLGVLVMFTSSLLSRALARPIARLQQGMEEVAQGKFEQVLPVKSRDEIGALVTTFNTMQGQLSESRQKIAAQERQLAWREMARQIAHEIKNPLTPMKLAIQHLQRSFEDKDDSRFKKLFQSTTASLIAQIDSLAHIANEFSSFARFPSRQVDTFDVRTVIHESYTLMKAEASSEIAMDVQISDEPLIVRGDASELRRMYINLIKNALEAVQETEKATVRITAISDGDQVISKVIDNGGGIPEQMKDQIYEPNFSTKTSGAGLGLAIAKQAVELSGGQISFKTQLGRGTTMKIILPLHQSESV